MKIFIVFVVTLFALNLQEGYGCGAGSYQHHRVDKYNEACHGRKRFRSICPDNLNNKYRDDINAWFLKKYWPNQVNQNPKLEANGTRSSNDSMTASEARQKGMHFGVDILCTKGSSVLAPFLGRVIYRGENKVIIKGLYTFKGFHIMMKNFNVSRSVLVNTCVAAGHHIGYTTRHEEPQGTPSYDVHIEVKGKDGKRRYVDWDPNYFICPVHYVKEDSKQRLAFFGTFGRLHKNSRLVFVDHDKAVEEAKAVDKEDEIDGEDYDQENGEQSGDDQEYSST